MKKRNVLFKIGIVDETTKKQKLFVAFSGFLFFLIIWVILTFPVTKQDAFGEYTDGLFIAKRILPSPQAILMAYPKLLTEGGLLHHLWKSLILNFAGYIEALLISVPLGFLMGLMPSFRHLLSPYLKVLRYLPLVAATPIFFAWFGIGFWMKVNFLAVGIIVYLLPVVFQRVGELEKVHEDTLWTLGANKWQTFRHVYFPGVMSALWKDIAVLTAISWTYITFAEMQNNQGGIGAMIFSARRGNMQDVYALLFAIMFVGFLQDLLFIWSDKKMFRFKYNDSK